MGRKLIAVLLSALLICMTITPVAAAESAGGYVSTSLWASLKANALGASAGFLGTIKDYLTEGVTLETATPDDLKGGYSRGAGAGRRPIYYNDASYYFKTVRDDSLFPFGSKSTYSSEKGNVSGWCTDYVYHVSGNMADRDNNFSKYYAPTVIEFLFVPPATGRYYFATDTPLVCNASDARWYYALYGSSDPLNNPYYFTTQSWLYTDGTPSPETPQRISTSRPIRTRYSFALTGGTKYQFSFWYCMFPDDPPCDKSFFQRQCGPIWLERDTSYDQPGTAEDVTPQTRPAGAITNYGIMGDNNQITKIDQTIIVDEISNTYYNPVINTTSSVTNWSYDYSDRSYHLTTETGDAVTVVYGDENITINQGGTTYNIYYITQDGGGGTTDPDPDNPDPGDPDKPNPDPDPDSPDNPSGGGLWDKILGFFKAIGKVITTVVTGFTNLLGAAVDGLVKLATLGGEFGQALASIYTWMPEEIKAVLVSAFTILITLSVVKLFLK